MRAKRKIALAASAIFFFIALFFLADSVICTAISEEACFQGALFDSIIIFASLFSAVLFFIGAENFLAHSEFAPHLN